MLTGAAVAFTLHLLDEVRARPEGPGNGDDGPDGLGGESEIHHGRAGRPQHVHVDRCVAGRLGRLDDRLRERDVLTRHAKLLGARKHALRGRVFQHQRGNAQRFVVALRRHQRLGCFLQGLPIGLGLFQRLELPVAKRRVSTVCMPESEYRGAASLGQKGLGAGHNSGQHGRHREPVLQSKNHDVVQHLILFNRRDAGLKINEQHVGQTVALLHQLGGVVAARHDPVPVLVGHLGDPLKRRPLGIERFRAVRPV